MTGRIERIDAHTFVIRGDDGQRYFAYRRSLDSFGPPFEALQLTMAVDFLGVPSDRRLDDPRAIGIRVIGPALPDGL